MIPSREYRDYLRNRGGRITFPSRHTAATVATPPAGEGTVPDGPNDSHRSGEPAELESTDRHPPLPILQDSTTVAESLSPPSAGVTAAPGDGNRRRQGGSGGGVEHNEGIRREAATVGAAGPAAETATSMGYTAVPQTARAEGPVSEAGKVGGERGGSDGGGGGSGGGRVGNTASAPPPQMKVDAESPPTIKDPWAKA